MDRAAGSIEREVSPQALLERLEGTVARLRSEAKERLAVASALAKVAKSRVLTHPRKLLDGLARLDRGVGTDASSRTGAAELLEDLRELLRRGPEILRRELGRDLQQAASTRNVELRVVSREEPVEVRLVPLSVVLDFDAGRASLRFARDAIATSELTAEAILTAREKALKSLEKPFDPERFFGLCRQAYLVALADRGGADGDRVELVDFLPYIALKMQGRGFLQNPTSAAFRSYSRGRFAYDVLRLRKSLGLAKGGLRMNLGVATGISASQKGRAVYFEDEHGNGEYKLSIFFQKVEGAPA